MSTADQEPEEDVEVVEEDVEQLSVHPAQPPHDGPKPLSVDDHW